MMGLAKMTPTGWTYYAREAPPGSTVWTYYAREVAAGVEDYYVGHGEEPGCWIGRGAEALGLSGEADVQGLPAVRTGLPPGQRSRVGPSVWCGQVDGGGVCVVVLATKIGVRPLGFGPR